MHCGIGNGRPFLRPLGASHAGEGPAKDARPRWVGPQGAASSSREVTWLNRACSHYLLVLNASGEVSACIAWRDSEYESRCVFFGGKLTGVIQKVYRPETGRSLKGHTRQHVRFRDSDPEGGLTKEGVCATVG